MVLFILKLPVFRSFSAYVAMSLLLARVLPTARSAVMQEVGVVSYVQGAHAGIQAWHSSTVSIAIASGAMLTTASPSLRRQNIRLADHPQQRLDDDYEDCDQGVFESCINAACPSPEPFKSLFAGLVVSFSFVTLFAKSMF